MGRHSYHTPRRRDSLSPRRQPSSSAASESSSGSSSRSETDSDPGDSESSSKYKHRRNAQRRSVTSSSDSDSDSDSGSSDTSSDSHERRLAKEPAEHRRKRRKRAKAKRERRLLYCACGLVLGILLLTLWIKIRDVGSSVTTPSPTAASAPNSPSKSKLSDSSGSTAKPSASSSSAASKPKPTPGSANSGPYKLVQDWRGDNFFDGWDFWDQADPTHGSVNYLSRDAAQAANLISTSADSIYMRVDNTTKLDAGKFRDSVRIHSKTPMKIGSVLIADIIEMPFGCSTWPAWWSHGPDWPNGGEIDIIEGVNNQPENAITLHVSDSECKQDPAVEVTGSPIPEK